jgi:hypothetical protein
MLYYMWIRILSNQKSQTEITASPTQPSNLITDEKSGELLCKVVQENQLTSYGLPTCWIKELKPRKNGSMMDTVRSLLFLTCSFLVFAQYLVYTGTVN